MPHKNLSFGRPFVLGAALLSLGACASVDQDAAFGGLQATLGERVTQDLTWRRDDVSDAQVSAKVDALLAQDLSFDAAVQVALLNNRGLQARYAEIGIANADLVQAGLVSNPVLDLMVRPTTNPSVGSILEFGLAQNVLDLFTRPARQRVAQAEFAKTQNEVAAAVVHTVGEVRAAYVTAIGARNARAVVKEIASASEASWELAQRFYKAGNISDLQLAEEQAMHEDMLVMVDEATLEADGATEDLSAFLNVSADVLKLTDRLPELPAIDAPSVGAEASALERRLDMIAARKNVSAHLEQLKLTTSTRLWQEIELKLSAEREPDGQWAIGPGLAIALPLFDQGGPAVARAAASVLKTDNDMRALESQIRVEVRKAMASVGAARRIAQRYRTAILPLKQDIVRLKQEKYNFMLIGVFDVLVAKREETSAYLGYVEAVRDYWLARAALADAMGGMALDTTAPAAGATP
jgi:cobalt-zinc-cadmium efflux system outer membrane protein